MEENIKKEYCDGEYVLTSSDVDHFILYRCDGNNVDYKSKEEDISLKHYGIYKLYSMALTAPYSNRNGIEYELSKDKKKIIFNLSGNVNVKIDFNCIFLEQNPIVLPIVLIEILDKQKVKK